MKDVTWIEAKDAANIAMGVINPKLSDNHKDFILEANVALPAILKQIAVHAFLYGNTVFGKELLVIRNALGQIEDKGYIGCGER